MTVTPYYDDGDTVIYHGDCRDIIPHLAFDCVVTDPPYGIAFEGYTLGKVAGDENDDAVRWLFEHTDPTIVTGANHFADLLPTRGAWSCWDKRVTEAADAMFGSPFELIWVAGDDRPGKIYRILHGGLVNADRPGKKRQHPTQKPVTLMSRLIQDWVDGDAAVILDPFMGSGTTLRAAKDLGRKSIGVELNELHCETAANRLSQGVLDFAPA